MARLLRAKRRLICGTGCLWHNISLGVFIRPADIESEASEKERKAQRISAWRDIIEVNDCDSWAGDIAPEVNDGDYERPVSEEEASNKRPPL